MTNTNIDKITELFSEGNVFNNIERYITYNKEERGKNSKYAISYFLVVQNKEDKIAFINLFKIKIKEYEAQLKQYKKDYKEAQRNSSNLPDLHKDLLCINSLYEVRSFIRKIFND